MEYPSIYSTICVFSPKKMLPGAVLLGQSVQLTAVEFPKFSRGHTDLSLEQTPEIGSIAKTCQAAYLLYGKPGLIEIEEQMLGRFDTAVYQVFDHAHADLCAETPVQLRGRDKMAGSEARQREWFIAMLMHELADALHQQAGSWQRMHNQRRLPAGENGLRTQIALYPLQQPQHQIADDLIEAARPHSQFVQDGLGNGFQVVIFHRDDAVAVVGRPACAADMAEQYGRQKQQP